MLIIFGLRRLRKNLGSVMLRCANCGWSPLAVVRISTWFALFFIPLIPLSFKYYGACPNCKRLDKVSKADVEQAKAQEGTPDVRSSQPATLEHAVNEWAAGGQASSADPATSATSAPSSPAIPSAAPAPPAGWYADPAGGGVQRYWDGQAWTEHTTPAQTGGSL